MEKIFVIHENEEWQPPLREAFQKRSLQHEEWFIDKIDIDLESKPPEGIFFNRMSASSHTRDHRYAAEATGTLLAWLELHERKVINGRRAVQLELRKSEQYLALKKFGIKTPKTIAVNDKSLIESAAKKLELFPFILKPNRGGKGLGVQLIRDIEHLQNLLANDQLGTSLDNIWLIQQYIKPADGHIVRVEFIGGEFHYAVRVDSSDGFELCPADVCKVEDAFCPADEKRPTSKNKFEIIRYYQNDDLEKYKVFFKDNDIQVGAVEYVVDEFGEKYVYDVNTNTNYNRQAELEAEVEMTAMDRIAEFLESELKTQQISWRVARAS